MLEICDCIYALDIVYELGDNPFDWIITDMNTWEDLSCGSVDYVPNNSEYPQGCTVHNSIDVIKYK